MKLARRLKRWPAFAALLVALTARADAPNDARRAQVCVHVGSRDITVGEVEDRMAQVPPFQLRTFGASDDEIRRNFVAQVIVPDALWAQGASARHLDAQIPTRFDLDRVRAQATLRALRARLGPPENVPMSDVQAYYDEIQSALRRARAHPDLAHLVCDARGGPVGARRGEEGPYRRPLGQAHAGAQPRQGDVSPQRQRRLRRRRRHVQRGGPAHRPGDPEGRPGGARRRVRPGSRGGRHRLRGRLAPRHGRREPSHGRRREGADPVVDSFVKKKRTRRRSSSTISGRRTSTRRTPSSSAASTSRRPTA